MVKSGHGSRRVSRDGTFLRTQPKGCGCRILSFSTVPFLLVLILYSQSFSQEITAKASTDKSEYLVGDYINYTISVNCSEGFKIYPPAFVVDSLRSISLIKAEKPDEAEESGKVSVAFKYVLSGYDSTGVTIPSIAVPYQSSGDSTTRFAYTNAVSFTIQTLKVDPQGQIKDVKPPMKILLDWKLILLWSLVGLLIVGILLYFYLSHRKKKGKTQPAQKDVALPSHVIALNALRELEQRKLWQKGMVKEYHSTITEIIRRYFETRFNMPAMELPTSEAIELLRRNRESEPILETTYDFLSNADLVKFAKFTPLNSVNEEMMKQAYEIINKTVPAAETGTNGSTDSGQEVISERIQSDNAN
jgi:hypothetical protein